MIFSRQVACAAALGSLLFASTLPANAATSQAKKSVHATKKSTHAAKIRKVSLNPDEAGEFANFAQWKEVADFITLMVEQHGFDRAELESAFRRVRYLDTAIQLVKPAPPGRPKNWRAYRARFIEPVRIDAGVAFWDSHANALARAEERFGVPAEIIVGILGVETIYGRNTGSFRVLDALTTLAFDYPATPNRSARMTFFRRELENTFLLAREAGVDPFFLFGSFAGAIGWPQFMPGSVRKFAIDFDGDGKVDLRNSPVDAVGSIANFLVEHGWQRNEPIVFPANVATSEQNRAWEMFIGQGLEAKFSLDEMKAAGVSPAIEPPAGMPFGLVDLQNGTEPTEYWLGAKNFFAITQYNRSFFYAMSVIDLGRAVSMARKR